MQLAQCALLTAALLVVDLLVPLGFALSLPYAVAVLAAQRARAPAAPLAFAAITTLAIGIGWLASPSAATLGPALVAANRLMAILVVWVIALSIALRLRSDRAREAADESTRLLLEATPVATVVVDELGLITRVNRSMEELLGQERRELVGTPLEHLVPGAMDVGGDARAASGAGSLPVARTLRARPPRGDAFAVDVARTPVRTTHGVQTLVTLTDVAERERVEQRLREKTIALQMINRVNLSLASELDTESLLQSVTDAATSLSGASFGAFFHVVVDESGDKFMLYTLSGARREAFERFALPRRTPLFDATFAGTGVVRSDDITKDPRYGRMAPDHGMPAGHLPVRSYLAVPVVERTGKVLGGLFLGHPAPGVFNDQSERIVRGIASQAAIAFENARLYERVRDSEERLRVIVEGLPAAIYTCDAQGRIQLFNRAAADLWGREPELGKDMWCGSWRMFTQDGQPLPHDACPMAVALREGRAIWGAEVLVERPDGGRSHVLVHPRPLYSESGEVRGALNMLVDITERERAEQALREADRRKDEFLATLAHELRNPLAPLRTSVEILRMSGGRAGALEQSCAVMERQVRQLARLVDDLMEVSRIRQGRLQLQRCPVDLRTIVEQAVESTRHLVDEASHTLSVHLPGEPVLLGADPLRLVQVIGNLLSNAAKYTPAGGHIEIAVTRDGRDGEEHALVSVRDDGIGIAPDRRDEIFEMFAQLDHSLESGFKGLGIGLTLVKSLVELHGGAVEVHSEGGGRGSTFTIRLPLRAETRAAPAEPAPDEPIVAPRAPRRRVLVVEDNRDAADTLVSLVAMLGHDVRVARDGQEAVEAAETFRPHVLLSDIGLPKLNGYEVARRVRAASWGRDVVLAAVTGWGQDADRQRAQAAGFDVHLTKPPEPSALQAVLDRASRARSHPAREDIADDATVDAGTDAPGHADAPTPARARSRNDTSARENGLPVGGQAPRDHVHELRNALNGMVLHLMLMQQQPQGHESDVQRAAVERALQIGKQLGALIDTLASATGRGGSACGTSP